MHILLDFDGNLLVYVNVTNDKTADNKGAYEVSLLNGSVIVATDFIMIFYSSTFGTAKEYSLSFVTKRTSNSFL